MKGAAGNVERKVSVSMVTWTAKDRTGTEHAGLLLTAAAIPSGCSGSPNRVCFDRCRAEPSPNGREPRWRDEGVDSPAHLPLCCHRVLGALWMAPPPARSLSAAPARFVGSVIAQSPPQPQLPALRSTTDGDLSGVPSESLSRQDKARIWQLCGLTHGAWCRKFHRQLAVPFKPVPRGSKSCPQDCSGVGNCNHDTGLCECPAGAQGRGGACGSC